MLLSASEMGSPINPSALIVAWPVGQFFQKYFHIKYHRKTFHNIFVQKRKSVISEMELKFLNTVLTESKLTPLEMQIFLFP